MKSLLVLFISLIVLLSSQVSSLKSFKDHKVVSFRIENKKQLNKLQILELESGVRKFNLCLREILFNKSLRIKVHVLGSTCSSQYEC